MDTNVLLCSSLSFLPKLHISKRGPQVPEVAQNSSAHLSLLPRSWVESHSSVEACCSCLQEVSGVDLRIMFVLSSKVRSRKCPRDVFSKVGLFQSTCVYPLWSSTRYLATVPPSSVAEPSPDTIPQCLGNPHDSQVTHHYLLTGHLLSKHLHQLTTT